MTIDRSIAPPVQEIRHVDLPAPEKRLLTNKIPIKVFHNAMLDLIHCTITIKAGSLFEPTKHLATACYQLLKESHPLYTASEVDARLDTLGVAFSVNVNWERIIIKMMIPKENCLPAMDIIGAFLLSPFFKQSNLNIYQQQTIKDLEYKDLNVGYRAMQNMFHLMFDDKKPFGTILHRKHIEALSCETLQAYHTSSFRAENVNLYITGNVDETFLRPLYTLFEQIPSGTPTPLIELYVNKPRKSLHKEKMPQAVQTSLIMCRRFLSYHHFDRRDFSFVSTILGGYFGSRLMQNLRETNGYTYGVHCSTNYFLDSSLFYIETDVNAAKSKKAIAAIESEMKLLARDPVNQYEINTVSQYLQGMQLRLVENSVNYMNSYIFWENFGSDESEIAQAIDTYRNISAKRILELARQYLDTRDYTTIIIEK